MWLQVQPSAGKLASEEPHHFDYYLYWYQLSAYTIELDRGPFQLIIGELRAINIAKVGNRKFGSVHTEVYRVDCGLSDCCFALGGPFLL